MRLPTPAPAEKLQALGLTFPASGQSYTVGPVHIYRIAGGQIREHWAVREDLSMLRQPGFELSFGSVPGRADDEAGE